MDNREIIQNSLDYIEENLKAEITAKDLADLSGYSMFYYYRIFQNYQRCVAQGRQGEVF